MKPWWEYLPTDLSKLALAGALGGLVRWITLRDRWREGAGAVVVGAISAMYLGPLVAPLLSPVIGNLAPGSDTSGLAAFVVGLGGVGVTGIVIDLIRARRRDIRKGDGDAGS